MTSRKMRISLVTAAVIAALAATSCGTDSLNEGLSDDVDLISSTSNPATGSGVSEVKMLMDLEVDFEIDKNMHELTEGQHSYPADSFRFKENAEVYEEEIGLGFDGEDFVPIMKPFLHLSAGEGEISSAIWSFEGASKELEIRAVRLQGKLEVEPNNGYYIAVSNYATDRYELLGPFQQVDSWIEVGSLGVASPAGELHIGVIMHDGLAFNIDEFEISTEPPLNQAL